MWNKNEGLSRDWMSGAGLDSQPCGISSSATLITVVLPGKCSNFERGSRGRSQRLSVFEATLRGYQPSYHTQNPVVDDALGVVAL